MSRRDSAPTHSWVISSKINKYITVIFCLLVVFVLIIVFSIRAIIAHDCDDYYKRDLRTPGYWIHVEVGSTKPECPSPHDD